MKSGKDTFKHYIFTRWNLLDDQMSIYNNPRFDAGQWMEHRMKIFDEITLPSIMIQTCKNFTWLLAFSRETPQWILDKYASFPHIRIIFEYPRTYLRKRLNSEIRDGDWIITSRIDNDDYVLPEYVETVQSYFDNTFKLVDVHGIKEVYETGDQYTVDRKSNNSPFISLIEKVGEPWMSISNDPSEKRLIEEPIKTVYYCSHSKMEWHFPSVKCPRILYKQIIHDKNTSNKIDEHNTKL